MLQAKTEEQRNYVEEIVKKHIEATQDNCNFYRACVYGNCNDVVEINLKYEDADLSIDIPFDMMAKIVDYLRKENEEVEIPTTCRVSADSDGVVYDLRETPHNEVMQFCKKLAWVKGSSFDAYYGQYSKTGKIRL